MLPVELSQKVIVVTSFHVLAELIMYYEVLNSPKTRIVLRNNTHDDFKECKLICDLNIPHVGIDEGFFDDWGWSILCIEEDHVPFAILCGLILRPYEIITGYYKVINNPLFMDEDVYR